eukprot:TRINITY_DN825_c0_g1::TRINITY_DN825_c0_g1_i1::g.25462::m.25462 TRINITY_DN825_c0_g1::TRINITY_DN825_c0_g1_i1::g.25462  ORF type:complete len:228 (+),score=69.79,sp/Q24799/MYPH_ECHGR/42.26/4e-37,CH/PF00307.26/1.6e-17,CAMSAP_CH/PF11971.3/0.002,CDC24/PF06395.6/0.089,CDC24/PF06395.6/6.9e+03 TRINITY_DN825_c0_g1_i1:55-738(+)
MADRANYAYGLDAELAAKQAAKYDPTLEKQAAEWITAMTGHEFGPGNFFNDLKSGTILCELINKIKPGTIPKIQQSSLPFKQMENIQSFLTAAEKLGANKFDLFQTVDLYELQNKNQVVNCLLALGSVAQKVPGYNGPKIGLRVADKNVRQFNEEQIKESKKAVPMTSMGDHGAAGNASGMFDRSRNIVKTTDSGAATSTIPQQSAGSVGGANQSGMVDKSRNIVRG